MPDETPEGQAAPAPEQGSEAPPPAPPEQGSDAEPFDEARARATIATQRAREKELDQERKALGKRLADAEARLKALDDEKLSEQERTARQLAEAQSALAELQAERQGLVVRHSVEREAAKLGFADPDDAYRFLDLAAVETDEDGQPKNVGKLLDAVLKAKPYLKGAPTPAGVPGPPRPANGDLGDAERAKQAVSLKQLW